MPTLTIPGATVTVSARAPLGVRPTAPTGIVPLVRPEFTVAVNVPSTKVRITLTGPTPAMVIDESGDETVQVRLDTDLTDGAYTWYAERWDGTAFTDASDPVTFTVDTTGAYGQTTVSGSLTISGQTPTLHLWFADPPSGSPGEVVTLFGHGFSATVDANIRGYAADTTGRVVHDPTADAYTDDRTINALTGDVDPQHHTVTLTVPEVPQPGGALSVNRV